MYQQMEFDCTLQSERDLKENVMVAVDFACKQLASQNLPTVVSRHEGYGIAAESWTELSAAINKIKTDMGSYLKVLPAGDPDAINQASSLYNSACDAAYEAIRMAAQANRVMNDLYSGLSEEKTPMEEYLESQEEEFENAEEMEGEEND